MSTWTHVAGIIRYDHVLSAVLVFDSSKKELRDAFKKTVLQNPPSGSEGTLTVVWTDKTDQDSIDSNSDYMLTAIIYGDLRDYDETDAEAIVKWFQENTTLLSDSDVLVRDAILSYYTEGSERRILSAGGPE